MTNELYKSKQKMLPVTDLIWLVAGMKHVVLFSGGLSSAYTAYLVAQKEKKEEIVLLHTPTYSENHDADIFRHQVARYLGMPITEWGDGRNIWELIDDNNCLPSYFIPFCTRILKQEMKEGYYKYLLSIGEEFIEYVGYGIEEWRRVQKARARNEAIGRKVCFPIFEERITSDEIKQTITKEWGIDLPSAYKELKHNNCVPCFKAGKGSWKVYWNSNPAEFEKAAAYEEQTGHTVFKDKSLRQLAAEWEKDTGEEYLQVSFAEMPCECWI